MDYKDSCSVISVYNSDWLVWNQRSCSRVRRFCCAKTAGTWGGCGRVSMCAGSLWFPKESARNISPWDVQHLMREGLRHRTASFGVAAQPNFFLTFFWVSVFFCSFSLRFLMSVFFLLQNLWDLVLWHAQIVLSYFLTYLFISGTCPRPMLFHTLVQKVTLFQDSEGLSSSTVIENTVWFAVVTSTIIYMSVSETTPEPHI